MKSSVGLWSPWMFFLAPRRPIQMLLPKFQVPCFTSTRRTPRPDEAYMQTLSVARPPLHLQIAFMMTSLSLLSMRLAILFLVAAA